VNSSLKEEKNNSQLKMNLMMSFSLIGIPDVLAYMHYIGDSYPFFDAVCREHILKYLFFRHGKKFIQAKPVMKITEQAKLIQNHLIETYQGYGYNLIEVPKTRLITFFFILDEISK
jgi:predicted ATPase